MDGARRAYAVVGHELASPLSALYTFIKLAGRGDAGALERVRDCADRIRAIADITRDFAHATGEPATVELALLVESTARTLAIEVAVEGHATAAIPSALATFVITTALRGIAEVHPATRLRVEITARELVVSARQAESWRPIDAWETPRAGLAAWSIAAAIAEHGGTVRLGGAGDAIAIDFGSPP